MTNLDIITTYELDHEYVHRFLNAFLSAGWRIIETRKYRDKTDGEWSHESVDYMLGSTSLLGHPKEYTEAVAERARKIDQIVSLSTQP